MAKERATPVDSMERNTILHRRLIQPTTLFCCINIQTVDVAIETIILQEIQK